MYKYILSLVVLVIVGCATSSKNLGFQIRPYSEKQLPNGARLIVVKDDVLPRVSIQLMSTEGSAAESAELAGVSSLMAQLLDHGTKKKSAQKIAEDFENMGSEFAAAASKDAIVVSASALAQYQKATFDLFFEVVTDAQFPESEFVKEKSQALAGIQRSIDNPQGFADRMAESTLYGDHPYARPVSGYLKTVRDIKRKDVVSIYSQFKDPRKLVVAITGKLDAQTVADVEKKLAALTVPQGNAVASLEVPKFISGVKVFVFNKPGLQQSQVRFMGRGIARTDEQFLKLRMANIVLGGAFASRLNQHVRDDLGLTYSISSSFDARKVSGPFSISTFTRDDKLSDTVNETLKVLSKFQEGGIEAEELKASKNLLNAQFPAALETTDRLAYNLLLLRLYGVSDSYLQNFQKNVSATDVSDVNEVIHQNFSPKNLQIVIFADMKKISAELAKIPFEKTVIDAKVE